MGPRKWIQGNFSRGLRGGARDWLQGAGFAIINEDSCFLAFKYDHRQHVNKDVNKNTMRFYTSHSNLKFKKVDLLPSHSHSFVC